MIKMSEVASRWIVHYIRDGSISHFSRGWSFCLTQKQSRTTVSRVHGVSDFNWRCTLSYCQSDFKITAGFVSMHPIMSIPQLSQWGHDKRPRRRVWRAVLRRLRVHLPWPERPRSSSYTAFSTQLDNAFVYHLIRARSLSDERRCRPRSKGGKGVRADVERKGGLGYCFERWMRAGVHTRTNVCMLCTLYTARFIPLECVPTRPRSSYVNESSGISFTY